MPEVKYPRTPHLFGSRGTEDDKHLSAEESAQFAADPSLIVEEKLDGTNVGIHFTTGMIGEQQEPVLRTLFDPENDLARSTPHQESPPADLRNCGRTCRVKWTIFLSPILKVNSSSRFLACPAPRPV